MQRRPDTSLAVRSVPLPFSGVRSSIATDGAQYGVVGADNGGHFARVAVGGGVVPGSVATVGGAAAAIPDVAHGPGGFLLSWSESRAGSPQPLKHALVSPASTASVISGVPLTTQTNAGFHKIASGPCGSAVVYGTFSPTALDRLEVRP